MAEYRRRILDDELDELSQQLAAIAIEGAKAVGKTETASQRAATTFELDDDAQRALAEADLDRVINSPPPVLIDEWQYLPATWDKVRRAVDAGAQAGSFLLTGSAAPSSDAGTHSGGGRIVSLRMRPLSLAERLPKPATVSLAELLTGARAQLSGQSEVSLEDYTEEILASGFPGIRGLSGRARSLQLDGYIARVVDRDFPQLGREVRNPEALRRWMAAYAAASSTTASFEAIRDASTGGQRQKPARSTVLPYRDVLTRLFILDEVPAWRPTRNHIRELGDPPKHQLVDPALACRLLGMNARGLLGGLAAGPPVPRDGMLLGGLFESLVTQSVRVYAQAAEATVRHLRTHRGDHEVDLIIERDDGRVVGVEIKLAPVPDINSLKHLTWLGETLGEDLLDSIIITTGDEAYRREDGIAVVPAALLGP
jgi:predicted AAA+ superfamily ATPase